MSAPSHPGDEAIHRLQDGDRLPSITAPVADDSELTIPDDLEGHWSIVIFYRGHW